MSLRLKILLMLFATLSIYGIIDYGFHRKYINPTFLDQEKFQANQHIVHTMATIDFVTRSLDVLCRDWSSWDDSYAFIQSKGQDHNYIQSNLGPTTFKNNNLLVIYFLDNSGRVIWKGTKDHQPFPLPDSEWNPTNPLLADNDLYSGFHMTDQGPLLLVSRPITDSEETLEPNGHLVMGRLIHGETINELINHLHGRVEFHPVAANKHLSISEIRHLKNSSRPLFKPLGTNLNIFKLMNDIHGKPSFILHLTTDRSTILHGLQMVTYNALSNVLSGFITIGIFILFVRNNVIKPITHLTSHVNTINTADDLSTFPLKTPKSDEIGILWQGFNQMVQRLQRDRLRRMAAEESQKSNQKRIQTILDTAPDGIITVDKEGIIESLNTAAARMFHYTVEGLEGESITKLTHSDYGEQIISVLRNYPETGHYKCFDCGCEMPGKLFDGSELPVHMRASSFQIGGETLFVWIIRDISELKKMNKKVEQSKRLAAIGEMGASIAHEIRNPLAGISGAAQMLLKGAKGDPRQVNILKEINVLIDRIENTVKQMLDYSRSWTPNKTDIVPLQLIREISIEAQTNSHFNKISFEFSGNELTSIPLDKNLIRQVLWNLFTNAAEAMPDGGMIHNHICVNDRILLISIRDEGQGMSEETTEKLFTPFYTTKIYGTGLGLPICQRIMEAHHGSIQIESELNVGTTITLRLPVADIKTE
ncbi:MAG: PAS domain S-box protein [Deltaproteobacteria bacterium]|nr:PAS domain S-box protein [Deltaproteobacteria bacterium]